VNDDKIKYYKQQDNQALIKAKYCPRVAAASTRHIEKHPKTYVTLTFDLENQ